MHVRMIVGLCRVGSRKSCDGAWKRVIWWKSMCGSRLLKFQQIQITNSTRMLIHKIPRGVRDMYAICTRTIFEIVKRAKQNSKFENFCRVDQMLTLLCKKCKFRQISDTMFYKNKSEEEQRKIERVLRIIRKLAIKGWNSAFFILERCRLESKGATVGIQYGKSLEEPTQRKQSENEKRVSRNSQEQTMSVAKVCKSCKNSWNPLFFSWWFRTILVF